ncbi:MAG: UvrD-helicase domain-containing protein [Chloroflexi bacterium]|nr:UvrD-helicase domain-containing protein [Chloroflexota bacterium]
MATETDPIADSRGQDILVAAGAGSGKTTKLVARYVSLLRDCKPSEVAAVTFTDAAAAEMRQRVRKKVMELAGLEAHRAKIDEAIIGTIHSLCFQVLREHPIEAGIDPGAGIMGEDESEFELLAACGDALETAAASDEDQAAALLEIGLFALRSQLPGMVGDRDQVRKAFARMGASPAGREEHVRAQLAAAAEPFRRQVVALRDALAVHHEARLRDDKLSARVAGIVDTLAPAATCAAEELGRLLAEAAPTRGGDGSAANWRDIGEVRHILDELKQLKDQLAAIAFSEADAHAVAVLPQLEALFEEACRLYDQRKQALDTLDYLDLELKARDLLAAYPAVADEYQESIRFLLVDEAQDLNPLQAEIIDLLSGRADGATKNGRVFFVGDEKQAIYGFRGSDVRLFTRLRDEIAAAGGEMHELGKSYRTHGPLVDAVNRVFQHVFAGATKAIHARPQDLEGRGGDAPPGPHLVLMPLVKATGDVPIRAEAALVAREIKRIVEAKTPVWDREDKAYRAAGYGDVAILLRAFTHLVPFEDALEAHGVPFATAAGSGYFDQQEVLDLQNLLTWLAEPDDEIALFAVLRSPLFLIDDATLLALRNADRYDLLGATGNPPAGLDPAIRARCKAAFKALGALRKLAATAPVDEILARALELTAVEAAWAALPRGEQANQNIRKLMALSQSLQGRSLDEFVDYLRRRRDQGAREAQAPVDQPHAVQVMTVHGAKGLQFPIVFVPQAHGGARSSAPAISWRGDTGISLKVDLGDDKPIAPGFHGLLAAQEKEEDRAEHRRLFYVAATRAADYLYLSGQEPPPDKASEGWSHLAAEALASHDGGGAVDLRDPVDPATVQWPPAPPPVIPDEAAEVEAAATLLLRPKVIPVRTSTPATALRAADYEGPRDRHDDGLASIRGTVAHRAIELRATGKPLPPLAGMVRALRDTAISDEDLERVAAGVEEILARFESSPLAATLRLPASEAKFEVPVAFDWDGLPMHGTIDLLYRNEGRWHVLDFKTNRVGRKALDELARPYLPQLGVYGLAIEKATGSRPALEIMFLDTGALHVLDPVAVDAALAEARARLDGGAEIADTEDLGGAAAEA